MHAMGISTDMKDKRHQSKAPNKELPGPAWTTWTGGQRRTRTRRQRRGSLGFNFRAAARILNPALLDKLPGTSTDRGLFNQRGQDPAR